jgi:excisionase family DNA binding protein
MAFNSILGGAMFLTVKAVAERLSVSLGTIYAEISAGRLKAHRFGRGRGAIRIAEDSLLEYLVGCAAEQPQHLPKPTGSFRHLRLK